jgi:hypothetical protein
LLARGKFGVCGADEAIPITSMRYPPYTTTDLTIHAHFTSSRPFHLAPGVGSGEFLLIDEKNPEKVHLVVRTINSSAFSNEDWEEYVYEVSTPGLVPTDWWRTTILGRFGS